MASIVEQHYQGDLGMVTLRVQTERALTNSQLNRLRVIVESIESLIEMVDTDA